MSCEQNAALADFGRSISSGDGACAAQNSALERLVSLVASRKSFSRAHRARARASRRQSPICGELRRLLTDDARRPSPGLRAASECATSCVSLRLGNENAHRRSSARIESTKESEPPPRGSQKAERRPRARARFLAAVHNVRRRANFPMHVDRGRRDFVLCARARARARARHLQPRSPQAERRRCRATSLVVPHNWRTLITSPLGHSTGWRMRALLARRSPARDRRAPSKRHAARERHICQPQPPTAAPLAAQIMRLRTSRIVCERRAKVFFFLLVFLFCSPIVASKRRRRRKAAALSLSIFELDECVRRFALVDRFYIIMSFAIADRLFAPKSKPRQSS